MNTTTRLSLGILALSGVLGASAAIAAQPLTCTSIVLDPAFLKSYPHAPAACQEVVSKNGVNKVHYKATVTDNSKGVITLTFLNTAKTPVTDGRPLKFSTTSDLTVSVNGKKVKASQLKKGDTVDFWVPEKMVGFNPEPESAEFIIFILD